MFEHSAAVTAILTERLKTYEWKTTRSQRYLILATIIAPCVRQRTFASTPMFSNLKLRR